MMHRTKVKRRFVLARNRRVDLGPPKHEEVAKCLRIRHFSGFRVFGGLRELRSSGAIRMHQPRTKTFVRGIILFYLYGCNAKSWFHAIYRNKTTILR